MKNLLHAILCASVLVLCQCSADPNENQLLTHFTAVHKSDTALPGQTIPPKNLVEIQLQRARAFRAALPEDLYQWTLTEPNLYAAMLNEFLDDYTPAHEFATVNMIWSMAYNANYSGDTFFADNDPETQLWSGPLQVIPTALDCGENTIKINFLTTASDGANAQQPVAEPLLALLKDGLITANAGLPLGQRINAIGIAATTNGSHIAASNHSKKLALDIVSLNGESIVSDPWDIKVSALQNAFDAQPEIRENFGPAFKHKTMRTGYRITYFKIPGHFDHLHISVQSP